MIRGFESHTFLNSPSGLRGWALPKRKEPRLKRDPVNLLRKAMRASPEQVRCGFPVLWLRMHRIK